MPAIIEWGKRDPSEPFRFYLHDKPNGMGKRTEWELPNLASPTLPWELIPLAILAVKDGEDRVKAGDAIAVVHSYLAGSHPRLVDAIRRTGDHATEVLEYIIREWIAHSQIDPSRSPSQP